MIWRLILFVLLGWVLGFALWMLSLGTPLAGGRSDAIVVVTGGPGRIERGLALLREGRAQRMLVSGVDPDVKPRELAAGYHIDAHMLACCIDLGKEATDTRSNADETAAWVRNHGFRSVRLVTTDWHMPRARLELRHALPGVEIAGDAVPSHPGFAILIREYHKYLVRRLALLIGAG